MRYILALFLFLIGYGAKDRLPMLTNSATAAPARVTKATIAAAAAANSAIVEDITYLVTGEQMRVNIGGWQYPWEGINRHSGSA